MVLLATACVKSKDEPGNGNDPKPDNEDPYDFSALQPDMSSDGKYITTVFEYRPAPGQFANENYPAYQTGDNDNSMTQKALQAIADNTTELISLGVFGGYVTFGFGHSVINHDGKDFAVFGNALYGNKRVTPHLGSCEPGVVYVSIDKNKNHLPDDEWFLLAGSEYHRSRHNYSVTYYRTPSDHIPTPGIPAYRTDTTLIRWLDCDGVTGYVEQNSYHTTNNYYPNWYSEDHITFSGELLPSNIQRSGTSYALHTYDWGYVDTHPNDSLNRNAFDISWAVNTNGQKIHLPFIDFVRVATAVLQQAGMMGDTSTEVTSAQIITEDEAKTLPKYEGQ